MMKRDVYTARQQREEREEELARSTPTMPQEQQEQIPQGGLAPTPIKRKFEQELDEQASLGVCRSCGASVWWSRSVDIAKRGHVRIIAASTVVERDGKRYGLSHFADCPQSKGWRK